MAFFGNLIRSLSFYFLLFVAVVSFLFFFFYRQRIHSSQLKPPRVLKVMSYSTFIKNWGPGPEIVKAFEAANDVRIEWIEVGNSGMILENLRNSHFYQPDLVIGLDFLSLIEAEKIQKWRTIELRHASWISDFPRELIFKNFIPMDWSPMTFIFRRSQIQAPKSLNDLLKKEYANSIAIQDPTKSSSGLYFLIWILSVYGEEEGFKYLEKLKSTIRLVSPSWSTSYSLFQNNQVPMVFSFFTSTIYHYVNEGDYQFQPVYFDEPHIYNVEYVAIPEGCQQCELANEFIHFILTPESQKKIMEKNFMLPVIEQVKEKTPFDFPKSIHLIPPESYKQLIEKREVLLRRWKELDI